MSEVKKLSYGEQAALEYNVRLAMEEAGRCLLCEDAPCSQSCPAETNPAKFIRSIRFRNFKGAAETIRENNILGGSCAMVCPYNNLCESACSRTGIDKPIQIGKLQKFAVDCEKQFDMHILEAPEKENGKKVICIGAGPASLACATKLRREGYDVTIVEQFDKAGGILTYGITPSRLPQDVVDFDIKQVKDLGVKFVMNKKTSKEDILKYANDYDAVFVGVGLWDSSLPNVEGVDAKGVVSALDFLKDARENKGNVDLGDEIIVIGGGDVALDCATTCKQLGKNVSIVYRRTIEEAPCNKIELEYLYSLGVPVHTRFAPKRIISENGKVTFMEFDSMQTKSTMKMQADMVIFAVGQKLENGFDGLAKGNVFVGGDASNKGASVVEAVKEGKEQALAIMNSLEGEK